jgi:CRP-like cAMP-binding protein
MRSSCATCPHRESGVLRAQPETCVENFSRRLVRYPVRGKGKTIFNQGDLTNGVYFLCEGLVKLTRVTRLGDEVTLDFLAPCSVIGGATSLKEGIKRVASAVTLGETTDVAFLKNEDYPDLLARHPTLGLAFSQHMAERLREAYKWIADLKLPVEARVIASLLHVCNFQTEETNPAAIKISVSHQELARFAQTTPETLSRTLRRLAQRGLVRLEKRGRLSVNAGALREMLTEGD